MAITKEIDIIANVSQAESSIKGLGDELEKTNASAKKVDKSLDEVASNGGAIAILDSLTGGLATRIKDAYEASKLFNISLKATRGALLATGIGALVVALGAVIAYWDDIKQFITGSNGELEDQIDLLDNEASILDRNLKILEDTDNILKLRGLSQKQINDLKRKELQDVIAIREQELLLANERLENIKEQEKAGVSSLERIFRFAQTSATNLGILLDTVLGKLGLNTEFAENTNQAVDSAIETLFGTEADKQEVEQRIKDITDQINAAKNQIAGFDLEAQEAARKAQERIDSQPKNLTAVGGVSVEGASIEDDPDVIFQKDKAERLAEIDKGLTDILIENARRELQEREVISNAKINLEQTTFALLRNIAKEGSALSKAVAIAEVVRDTTKGVANIISNTAVANAKAAAASPLTAGQPWVTANTIAGGLGIGASIAGAVSAIKDITSEKKTIGAGGGGLPSAGGGVSAPSFNLVQGTGSNQIAEGLGSERQPIRAYVVTNDVTSGQELDRNIQGGASLG
tara:strand:- start:13663 stop:15219 length:1557 start_codon:yes stop_codon:yes gene_type:complete